MTRPPDWPRGRPGAHTPAARPAMPYRPGDVVRDLAMTDPAGVMAFLASLNPTGIAFNIEEREGINTGRPLVAAGDAVAFWSGVLASLHDHQVSVREIAGIASYVAAVQAGKPWHPAQRSPVPTVAWNGDVTLMSPELNGLTAPRYQNFRAGNIHHQPLAGIIARAGHLSYVREYATGLARCARECSFYQFCRGGDGRRNIMSGT